MTAFMIAYGTDPADRFTATAHVTREAARMASLRGPTVPPSDAGGCAYVIENAEDVTFSGTLLVAVYNALTGSGIKKFETREIGVRRLLAALQTLPTSKETPMETETVTNEAETPKAKRGRASRFASEHRIRVVSEKNPKRGKAAERFNLYRDGMTVEQYLAAGGTTADLAWDTTKGLVQVAA